jgi:hypothetical protein
MDTFVENTGVAEQDKQIQVTPTEHEKQIQVPVENAETANEPLNEDTTVWESHDKEPEKQIKIVRAQEKPDPLGRQIASLPLNEIKAGYDYAFGKGRPRR